MICGSKNDHSKKKKTKKTQIYIKSVVLNFHGGGAGGGMEMISSKMSNKPPGAVKIHIVL